MCVYLCGVWILECEYIISCVYVDICIHALVSASVYQCMNICVFLYLLRKVIYADVTE